MPKQTSWRDDTRLLNEGLCLAMEWGENWLKPIQPRLCELHPELSRETLNEIDLFCRKAMQEAHELVKEMITNQGLNVNHEAYSRNLRERHPWINDENIARLHSQGMYYSLK